MSYETLYQRFEKATTEAEIDQLITDKFDYKKDRFQVAPIIHACKKGKFEVVQALVKHGVDHNCEHGTRFNLNRPINIATSYGHLKIVEYFISIGSGIAYAIWRSRQFIIANFLTHLYTL
jgi:hypothetical protein